MNKHRNANFFILIGVIVIAAMTFTGCTKDDNEPKNSSGIVSNTPGHSSPTPTLNSQSTPTPNKGVDFDDLSTQNTPIFTADNGKISPGLSNSPIIRPMATPANTQTATAANTGNSTMEVRQTPQISPDKPTVTVSLDLGSQEQWTKPIK